MGFLCNGLDGADWLGLVSSADVFFGVTHFGMIVTVSVLSLVRSSFGEFVVNSSTHEECTPSDCVDGTETIWSDEMTSTFSLFGIFSILKV